MKKFLKKAEGFTLVELIVVIAILGILAGVAIPAYSGYMTKANETADITALAAVKTAATATMAKVGEVTYIEVDTANDKVTVKVGTNGTATVITTNDGNTYDDDFTVYYGKNSFSDTFKTKLSNGNVATKATWTKGSNNDAWVFS